MTLLHLVSEQRLQNLIPLLALGPDTVVQVLRGSARFTEVASHLEDAVGTLLPAESRPQFHHVVLESHAPSIEETRSEVLLALKNHGMPAVVNITGGTKPMSIGAFLAAEDFGVPALYFDRGFHSAGTAAIPEMKSLPDILSGLTVPALLAAGVKVVLSTDDPAFFATNLACEFALAARLGLSAEDLEQIRRNGFHYAAGAAPTP